MNTIELSDQQINNLSMFLDRVQVTGMQENTAYMEIVESIKGSLKGKEPKVSKETK